MWILWIEARYSTWSLPNVYIYEEVLILVRTDQIKTLITEENGVWQNKSGNCGFDEKL